MKHLKAAKRLKVNLTDQRLSDLARYDERFVSVNRDYLELNCLYDCIESLRKIAEKDMEVISREITVRDVQINAEARGRGIGAPSRFDSDRYRGSAANMPTEKKRKVSRAKTGKAPTSKKPKSKFSVKRGNLKGPRKAKRD
jgi:hypothetical protein